MRQLLSKLWWYSTKTVEKANLFSKYSKLSQSCTKNNHKKERVSGEKDREVDIKWPATEQLLIFGKSSTAGVNPKCTVDKMKSFLKNRVRNTCSMISVTQSPTPEGH